MNFCCGVLQLFELPRCKEGHQTALYCLELFGRSKCLVTGLDASLSFLLRREGVLRIVVIRLPVSSIYNFLQ